MQDLENRYTTNELSIGNLIDVLSENNIIVYYDKELKEEIEQISKSLSVALKQKSNEFAEIFKSLSEKPTKSLMPLYWIDDEIYCQKEGKKTIVVLIELFFRHCVGLGENYDFSVG